MSARAWFYGLLFSAILWALIGALVYVAVELT